MQCCKVDTFCFWYIWRQFKIIYVDQRRGGDEQGITNSIFPSETLININLPSYRFFLIFISYTLLFFSFSLPAYVTLFQRVRERERERVCVVPHGRRGSISWKVIHRGGILFVCSAPLIAAIKIDFNIFSLPPFSFFHPHPLLDTSRERLKFFPISFIHFSLSQSLSLSLS